MSHVPVEHLLERNQNIYKLVLLASKRAMELSEGATPLVAKNGDDRATSLALREIMGNKISIKGEKEKEKSGSKRVKK